MTNNTLAPFAARIERKGLVDALKLLAKVVEKRNTIPILSCVLLVPGDGFVTIRGTDMDIFVAVDVTADCQPGRGLAVDAAALKAAVSKAKSDAISLADVGGERAAFRDGDNGATLRMPAREAPDFPAITMGTMGDEFDFDAAQLASDIGRTRVAVSTEETRYYLNGIFFHRTTDEYGNDVLRMAATDGHRLARITRPCPAGMPEDFPDSIVPRKACDVMSAALHKRDGVARLAFSASKVRFRAGRVLIEAKLIDGTFPDYSRVIPSQWERSVTIPAETLADAAKGVTAHASGKTKAAKFSWNSRAGWMTAYASCVDNGPAMMPVEGGAFEDRTSEDGAFSIGMNATYLAKLMAKWDGQPVTLHCADASCPILITARGAPEYVQVLMPMRVDGPVITPDYMARLNRSPLDAFNADAPAAIAKLAAIEADADLTPTGKRYALREASRDLARLVQGAIAHQVSTGWPRREARLMLLLKLAHLRGDDAAVYRLNAIYSHKPVSSFIEWERGIVGETSENIGHLPDHRLQHLESVESPSPTPLSTPGEAAPGEAEPEPVAAVVIPALPGEKPLFRTLQDFKAMAGVGSRWSLRNWDSRKGEWGEERFRIVATVKARQLGFVPDGATDLEIAAARDMGNFGGRSWFDFPKQGDWDATPDALVTRFRDGGPCMMIVPAPLSVDDAPAIVQHEGEAAALREMVVAMAERLARLESASQSPTETPALPHVEEAESLPVPALANNSGNLDGYVTRAEYEAALARADAYEEAARGWKENAETARADANRFMRNWERATRRAARVTAVLAGRKAQLDRREGELRFAHAKGAQLQRELAEARGESTVLPVAPSIILPATFAA